MKKVKVIFRNTNINHRLRSRSQRKAIAGAEAVILVNILCYSLSCWFNIE